MSLNFLTKLFHFDSADAPSLDTDTLEKIKQSWEIELVSGAENDPLVPFKEQGIAIILEEILTHHGRKIGEVWRSTTKGRGRE